MTKVTNFYVCAHGGYHVDVISDSRRKAYNAGYNRIVREVRARQGEQKVSLSLKVIDNGQKYNVRECDW